MIAPVRHDTPAREDRVSRKALVLLAACLGAGLVASFVVCRPVLGLLRLIVPLR